MRKKYESVSGQQLNKPVYVTGSQDKAKGYAVVKNEKARTTHYSVRKLKDRYGRDLYGVCKD